MRNGRRKCNTLMYSLGINESLHILHIFLLCFIFSQMSFMKLFEEPHMKIRINNRYYCSKFLKLELVLVNSKAYINRNKNISPGSHGTHSLSTNTRSKYRPVCDRVIVAVRTTWSIYGSKRCVQNN